jgi:TolB protein
MKTEHLRRQLNGLDEIEPPDLRAGIASRIRLGESAPLTPDLGPRKRAGRTGLAVGLIAAAVAVFGLVRIFPTGRTHEGDPGGSGLGGGSIVLGLGSENGTQLYTISKGSGAEPIGTPGSTFLGWEGEIAPDGSRVAFVGGDPDATSLFVGDLDDAAADRIGDPPGNGSDEGPAWSPDGSRIVFSRNRIGHPELFTIGADGSDLRQLTVNTEGVDVEAAWSLDGSRIVFVRNSGGPIDLWVVAADGGEPTPLTRYGLEAGGFPESPAWSPNGDRIAFTANPEADRKAFEHDVPRDVWVMNGDGSGPGPVLETPNDERSPAWSPDGSKLVFLQSVDTDPAEPYLRGQYRVVVYDLVTQETMVLLPSLPVELMWLVSLQWIELDTASSPETSTAVSTPSPEESAEPPAAHAGEALVEETSEQQQAEIFAFRAVAAEGLMDPHGSRSYLFTYADDTTRTADGWRIGFASSDCEPQQTDEGFHFTCRGLSGEDELGNALTDTYVSVGLHDGLWRVLDIEGNMLPDERERLLGVSLPQRTEPSHWEFPAIGHWDYEGTAHVEMVALWVGPYPTAAPGSFCEVHPIDADGASTGEPMRFYEPPPSRPFERGGWIRGMGLPEGSAGIADVACRQRTDAG